MKQRLAPLLILSLLCIQCALASPSAAAGDVKSLRIDTGQAASYALWQDGAHMRLSQAEEGVRDGNTALRVDLTGTNEATGATSGSFYHILPETRRDWSQTGFIRFWIKNASEKSLLFNCSFKEAANEDWGLGQEGAFYLEDEDGMYYPCDYHYCNLEIPAGYEGYVVLPYSSMTVPDWSTAKGDRTLRLDNIETYAFGAQYSDAPQTFYLDEVTVASDPDTRAVGVRLPKDAVAIPKQGETTMRFDAYVTNLSGDFSDEDVVFSLKGSYDDVALSKDGALTVQAGAAPADVAVTAAVAGKPQYYHTFTVRVGDAPVTSAPNGTGGTDASAAPRDATPQQSAVIVAAGVTFLILAAAVLSALLHRRRKS